MRNLMPALARDKAAQIRTNPVENLAIHMDSYLVLIIGVTYQIRTSIEQGSSVPSKQHTQTSPKSPRMPTYSFHSTCSLQSSWL
jgi:hypothetical protein